MYFDIFKNIEDVHEQWIGSQDVKDEEVLFAVYSYEDYSGSAFLIYKRDNVLFEVHDAHCSCFGLENWVPEETSWAALAMRSYEEYGKEANDYFQALVKKHAN